MLSDFLGEIGKRHQNVAPKALSQVLVLLSAINQEERRRLAVLEQRFQLAGGNFPALIVVEDGIEEHGLRNDFYGRAQASVLVEFLRHVLRLSHATM